MAVRVDSWFNYMGAGLGRNPGMGIAPSRFGIHPRLHLPLFFLITFLLLIQMLGR